MTDTGNGADILIEPAFCNGLPQLWIRGLWLEWQSVVCCGVPLVGSRGDGATVWPRSEQQIGIGVGLGHVPNIERRNGGYRQCCVVIFARFWGGFWGFWGGVVDFSLVIGLITHSVCDLLPWNEWSRRGWNIEIYSPEVDNIGFGTALRFHVLILRYWFLRVILGVSGVSRVWCDGRAGRPL